MYWFVGPHVDRTRAVYIKDARERYFDDQFEKKKRAKSMSQWKRKEWWREPRQEILRSWNRHLCSAFFISLVFISLLSLSPDICRRAAECKKFKSSIGYSFTKKPPRPILKCLAILGKLCVTHCSWTKWVKGCDLIEVGVDMERYYSPTLGFLGEKLGLVMAAAPAIGSTCIWNPVRWEQLYIYISFPWDLSLCDFSPSPCFDGWDCCARFSMQFLGM